MRRRRQIFYANRVLFASLRCSHSSLRCSLFWMPLNRLIYFITKPLDNYFGFTYKTIKTIKPYL
jgi:hypothetical protein